MLITKAFEVSYNFLRYNMEPLHDRNVMAIKCLDTFLAEILVLETRFTNLDYQ